MQVKVTFTVKTPYGRSLRRQHTTFFHCEFDLDPQEWVCSKHTRRLAALYWTGYEQGKAAYMNHYRLVDESSIPFFVAFAAGAASGAVCQLGFRAWLA